MCFSADGRIFEWSHDRSEPALVDTTFDELLLRETRALLDARNRLEQEPPDWLWSRRLHCAQSSSVCLRAIQELRALQAPGHETMAALSAAVGHSDSEVSRAASDALSTMAHLYVPLLIERLKSPKARERQDAAVCLGAMGKWALAAVPSLTDALQDIRRTVSRAAAAALQRIKE